MHYANGREAHSGDSVITKGYSDIFFVGTLHSLLATSDTCNAQIAYVVPGGVMHLCVTVSQCYHAEDALAAITPKVNVTTVPPAVAEPALVAIVPAAAPSQQAAPAPAPEQSPTPIA